MDKKRVFQGRGTTSAKARSKNSVGCLGKTRVAQNTSCVSVWVGVLVYVCV